MRQHMLLQPEVITAVVNRIKKELESMGEDLNLSPYEAVGGSLFAIGYLSHLFGVMRSGLEESLWLGWDASESVEEKE